MKNQSETYIEKKGNYKAKGKGEGKNVFLVFLKRLAMMLLAVLFIRTFLFDSYSIDSASMEGELLKGDIVFINKIKYGARVPSGIKIPFVAVRSPLFKVFGFNPYISSFAIPYFRFPAISTIKRDDILAFNIPVDKMPAPDLKVVYIKRCVGLPGDTIEIKGGLLFVNGAIQTFRQEQMLYKVVSKAPLNYYNTKDWQLHDYYSQVSTIKTFGNEDTYTYRLVANSESIEQVRKDPNLVDFSWSLDSVIFKDIDIYPHSVLFNWNKDNFGPIIIPGKGIEFDLDTLSSAVYFPVIHSYENGNYKLVDGKIFDESGSLVKRYHWKKNYYFMLGDNRTQSLDSRNWGFLPEDHIVGGVSFIWYSSGREGNRFNRIFKAPE